MIHQKNRNKGSITVEACLVIPLFLFFMLAVGELVMLLFAEAHIHQSLAEAADYTAQYCYLEKKLSKEQFRQAEIVVNTAVLTKQFQSYLGEDFYVEKTIRNGKSGILLYIKKDIENDKIFVATADYLARIQIPLLGEYYLQVKDCIKQKAFIGYSKEEKGDIYVYVTPNQEVYHSRRSCSHLSVSTTTLGTENKGNYTACSFCGAQNNDSGSIYVSRTTNVYHYRADCSGLKRTVSRVKRSEVGGLGPCQRCGR